jgi:MFS family permease
MPLSGRLTDRVGGGIVAFVGVLVTVLGTIPFAFMDERTSYWDTSLAMLLRGFGIGVAMMPAMAAAYATLRREQVMDATPQLNVISRVGGSIGTALFAVVLARRLQHSSAGVHGLAGAYGHTYWWVVAVTAAGVVPAALLARFERVRSRARASAQAVESAA